MKMPGKNAVCSAAREGCMSGEGKNPGGSGLVLRRAESTLSQPELQEMMNLKAYGKRGRKNPKIQNKTETLHIPPVSSNSKRNTPFQVAMEWLWANIM